MGADISCSAAARGLGAMPMGMLGEGMLGDFSYSPPSVCSAAIRGLLLAGSGTGPPGLMRRGFGMGESPDPESNGGASLTGDSLTMDWGPETGSMVGALESTGDSTGAPIEFAVETLGRLGFGVGTALSVTNGALAAPLALWTVSSTNAARVLSVGKTPWPELATPSMVGAPLGFKLALSSSTVSASGRSRLLY